jgi:hypothetical protein
VLYKFSILCDVEYDLCLCGSVVVYHPSRSELTVVRIGDVVLAMVGMVEMVNTVMACGARIC